MSCVTLQEGVFHRRPFAFGNFGVEDTSVLLSEACVVPAHLPIFQLLQQLAPQVIHKNSLFYFVADHLSLRSRDYFGGEFSPLGAKKGAVNCPKDFFVRKKKAQSCNILREKSGTCHIYIICSCLSWRLKKSLL
jgi:hypothetical protein